MSDMKRTHSPLMSIIAGVLTIVGIVLIDYQFQPEYLFGDHPVVALAVWTPAGGFLGAMIFWLFRDSWITGFIFGSIIQALFVSLLPHVY